MQYALIEVGSGEQIDAWIKPDGSAVWPFNGGALWRVIATKGDFTLIQPLTPTTPCQTN